MGKTSLAALVSLPVVVVAVAAFGPGPRPSVDGGNGAAALLHAAAVSAATLSPYRDPSGGYTSIDQHQTATPTSAAPQSAAAALQPLVRTVRLTPYTDASVASGGLWPSSQNLGGWSTLRVGPGGGGYFRSYVRFLMGGLPPGMQIDSALLILTASSGGLQPVPFEADYVLDPWDESTIAWDQQPLATYQAGIATWQPGDPGPLSIDVTPAVQQWYACGSSANNGLLLSADLAPNYVDFDSSKAASPPVLQITYQTAVAPVNCAAPPTNNVNLTAPAGVNPSTNGAAIGAQFIGTPFNPNPRPVAPQSVGGGGSSGSGGGNTGTASGSAGSTGGSEIGGTSSSTAPAVVTPAPPGSASSDVMPPVPNGSTPPVVVTPTPG